MLVLTRRTGEEIVIGKDVRLTVVAVKGGRISLGISAPGSVSIQRVEIRTSHKTASKDNPRGPERHEECLDARQWTLLRSQALCL